MSVAKKLTTVAQNMSKVYAAGKEAGVQSEYDRFWDAFQDYGKRTSYSYAFAGGLNWTKEHFRPKYDLIVAGGSSSMFVDAFRKEEEPLDFVELFNELGIVLDFSTMGNCIVFDMFQNAKICHLGVIDLRKKTGSLSNWFRSSYLRKIDLIRLGTDNDNTFQNSFNGDTALEEVYFEGVIYADINFQHSPLIKASIKNIMSCLSDSTSGTTVSFNLNAVNTAFETSEGAADGSESEEWLALVATKPNWTINLV